MSSHQPANFPKGIPSFTQNSSLLVLNGRMLRSYEYNTNENDFQQDSDSSCISLSVEILAKLKKGCFCSLIAVGGCYQLPDNSIGVELRGCPVSPVPAKGSSSLLRVGKHRGWPGDTCWVPRCPAPSPEPQPLPSRRALLSLPAPFLHTKGGRKWFCFCRSSAGWWDVNVCVHSLRVKDSSWV